MEGFILGILRYITHHIDTSQLNSIDKNLSFSFPFMSYKKTKTWMSLSFLITETPSLFSIAFAGFSLILIEKSSYL